MIRRIVRALQRGTASYLGCLSNEEIDRRLADIDTEIAETKELLGHARAQLDELYVGAPADREVHHG